MRQAEKYKSLFFYIIAPALAALFVYILVSCTNTPGKIQEDIPPDTAAFDRETTPPDITALSNLEAASVRVWDIRRQLISIDCPSYFPGDWESVNILYNQAEQQKKMSTLRETQESTIRYLMITEAFEALNKKTLALVYEDHPELLQAASGTMLVISLPLGPSAGEPKIAVISPESAPAPTVQISAPVVATATPVTPEPVPIPTVQESVPVAVVESTAPVATVSPVTPEPAPTPTVQESVPVAVVESTAPVATATPITPEPVPIPTVQESVPVAVVESTAPVATVSPVSPESEPTVQISAPEIAKVTQEPAEPVEQESAPTIVAVIPEPVSAAKEHKMEQTRKSKSLLFYIAVPVLVTLLLCMLILWIRKRSSKN